MGARVGRYRPVTHGHCKRARTGSWSRRDTVADRFSSPINYYRNDNTKQNAEKVGRGRLPTPTFCVLCFKPFQQYFVAPPVPGCGFSMLLMVRNAGAAGQAKQTVLYRFSGGTNWLIKSLDDSGEHGWEDVIGLGGLL